MKAFKAFLMAVGIHVFVTTFSTCIAYATNCNEPFAVGVGSSVLILWYVYLRGDKWGSNA